MLYGEADHIDENDGVIEPYYTEPFSYERLKDVCFLCQPAVSFAHGRRPVRTARNRSALLHGLRVLAQDPGGPRRHTFCSRRLPARGCTRKRKRSAARRRSTARFWRCSGPSSASLRLAGSTTLAHVIVRERGLTRDTPAEDRAVRRRADRRHRRGVRPILRRHPVRPGTNACGWRNMVRDAVRADDGDRV